MSTTNDSSIRLREAALDRLSDRFQVPRYDRSAIRPAIVHFGVGGFHRAHQEVYTDELLASGDLDWGIRGAGITARDPQMRAALAPQDFLYSVIARDIDGEDRRIVGSLLDLVLGVESSGPVVDALADERTRIVSFTVTENGYCYRPETIDLDTDNAAVQNDLRGGTPYRTIYGYLRAALQRVRSEGRRPPTLLSCDNLPQNGDRLRKLFLQFLAEADPELRSYVEGEVEFPNCMVDRITPLTTDEQKRALADDYRLIDEWPVLCERFRQWVIEDRFTAGRPDWSAVGATFVSDVVPFERMKIRLLNGSHSALGYVSYLLGYRRVDLAMADDEIRSFVRGYMDEITPSVGTVPGIDLEGYKGSLVERFANPAIADQILRLAQDGSKKIPNMILEPIAELLAEGREIGQAAFALAAWIRFLEGIDEEGHETPIDDPLAEQLQSAARACSADDVGPFLRLGSVFPTELSSHPTLIATTARSLAEIRTRGMRSALRGLLGRR